MPALRPAPTPRLVVKPVTPDRWPDLERLFGPRGACAGCWCMWWKQSKPEFVAGKGEGNRDALRRSVAAGGVPGLLAYEAATPVGWVAIEPRGAYPRLARSRTLAPVDGEPVWSITCFYVARTHRGRGVMRALIEGALRHARRRGAATVEAYPRDFRGKTVADGTVYVGAASTFAALGFEEVARRIPTRPIVRRTLTPRASAGRARARGRSTRRSSPTPRSGSRRGR